LEEIMGYIEEMFGLEKEVVVITGAGGVLAGSIAEAFAKAGAKVSLWVRREEAIEEVRSHIMPLAPSAGKVQVLAVDAGDKARVAAAYDEAEKTLGAPTVLVNAVGGNRGKGPFVDADPAAFEDIIRLNLVAGLLVPSQIFAARWLKAGIKGSIVNIASMGSYVPLSGVWAYNAAKAGVLNLTQACAKEFGAAGIRVNAVAPGFFLGKQNKALLVANEATGELTARGNDVVRRTPFGRFGKAEELSGAVLYLASPRAASFTTGVCIPVDGGFLVDCI
jgi:NAD(P)-dependent dehydrogenase (short-subunit alcohol dehydrogenase family)